METENYFRLLDISFLCNLHDVLEQNKDVRDKQLKKLTNSFSYLKAFIFKYIYLRHL